MASACQKTMRVRERKLRRRGQDRKNALENQGSTPSVEKLFQVQSKKR